MSVEEFKSRWPVTAADAAPVVHMGAFASTPVAGTKARLHARNAKLAHEIACLLEQAGEMGRKWGGETFEAAVDALALKIRADRKGKPDDYESALHLDIEATLAHFADYRHSLVAPHLDAEDSSSEPRLRHWLAARSEFGSRVLLIVVGLLAEVEYRIGPARWRKEWRIGDLDSLVLAFVFPGDGVTPPSEAWKGAALVKMRDMKAALVEATTR